MFGKKETEYQYLSRRLYEQRRIVYPPLAISEVAAIAGVSVPTYRQWENRDVPTFADVTQAGRISHHYGWDLSLSKWPGIKKLAS